MVTHATALAVVFLAVDDLLLGIDVKLPTCPECAVLVDAALEAR